MISIRKILYFFSIINIFNISYAEPYITKDINENVNLEYKFNINSSLISGNVERFLLLGRGDFSIFNPKIGFSSLNTYQLGTISNKLTENDIISRNFIYILPENTIYPYIMAWFEKNQRRQIDYRYQIGLGSSFVFINDTNNKSKLSITFTNEQTDFNSNNFLNFDNKLSEIINTWRLTLRLAGNSNIIKDKLKFNYELWLQPSIININNFRAHIESSFEFPLNKNFSLLSSINYNYESIVLNNVKQNDFIFLLGLSING